VQPAASLADLIITKQMDKTVLYLRIKQKYYNSVTVFRKLLISPVKYDILNKNLITDKLGQHRTMIACELRSQIFRQLA